MQDMRLFYFFFSIYYFPINKIITIDEISSTSTVGEIAEALAQIIAAKSPKALLITSSAKGKEIAARVAVATNSGIITDAIDIDADLITT